MKKQELFNVDWDYLIILDACRYDIFEEVYDNYLNGELVKKESKGSSTLDWLVNNFKQKKEINYFSSNPYINSKGIALNESKWGASCGYNWTAKNYFEEIIDIWDFGWNEELGTVHPKRVNETIVKNSEKLNKKTIIHYMQPHAPYISNGKSLKLRRIRNGLIENEKSHFSKIKKKLRNKIESSLTEKEISMKMGMILNLGIEDIILSLKNNGIKEKIIKYYKQNLELALKYVEKLVDQLEGKIIVTSDHGEAFGEQGVWEHHVEKRIPPLIEVPWLKL